MDYLKAIEHMSQKSCVIAIRKNDDGERRITIEAASRAYLESVNRQDEEFIPGRPYTYYIAADQNFESFCFRCVTTRATQHQYINADLYDSWLDLYLLPLESDEPDVDYCLFWYEMTPKPESEKLLDINSDTAMQVLKTCIRLRETDDFQAAMDSIIVDIRKMCDSSACSILLTDFEAKKCSILCVDHDETFSVENDNIIFLDEFYEIAETWRDLMAGSNCYIIADERDMKIVEQKDPKWAASLKVSGIYNVVLYPLRLNKKILGYIWATNFNPEKIMMIREVMELNAFLLAAEIANHQMYEEMEHMSRYDMLTGVMNRNAMNNRISECKTNANVLEGGYGVVFVDVNGLKQINDLKGHMAGDEMIKSVAERLSEIFEGYEIYRAGGDEFMILAPDCPKEKFTYLVEKLKNQDEKSSPVRFAVGSCYDDSEHDIKHALHAADAAMYIDKSDYYKVHPELSRRSE